MDTRNPASGGGTNGWEHLLAAGLSAVTGLWLLALWPRPLRGTSVYVQGRYIAFNPFDGSIALLALPIIVLAALLLTRREPVARLLLVLMGILIYSSGTLAFTALKAYRLVAGADDPSVRAHFPASTYLLVFRHCAGVLVVTVLAFPLVWRACTHLQRQSQVSRAAA